MNIELTEDESYLVANALHSLAARVSARVISSPHQHHTTAIETIGTAKELQAMIESKRDVT